MKKPKSKRLSEVDEIELLESWINSGKPVSGSNPSSAMKPLPSKSPVGKTGDKNTFYAAGDKEMTHIQRASLPHSLCVDIFWILEKLYRLRWSPEDGVGSIIITPTWELADQIFEVLTEVGKHHGFSGGLLIASKAAATLLFSANQTKSVKDLGRLSLKDPEYISLHEEDKDATPSSLQQTAIIVPLHQKLDMLCSFIKANLKSKILIFLSTCKQVTYNSSLKCLRSCIQEFPLKCLHGWMKLERRMIIYSQFYESGTCSFLFSTDVSSRGLDFKKEPVDWVVHVDCPDDEKSYIHRVGRTPRNCAVGRSVLFLDPSEEEMLKKLRSKKCPAFVAIFIHSIFVHANMEKLRSVSELVAALLVKYPNMLLLAQRAFITYVKSIHKQGDKEVSSYDPKLRFLNKKTISKPLLGVVAPQEENATSDDVSTSLLKLKKVNNSHSVARVPKKLKIDPHGPFGTKLNFDEGDLLPPLAIMCKRHNGSIELDRGRFCKKKRLQEKRKKQKEMRGRDEKESDEDSKLTSGSNGDVDSGSNDVGRGNRDTL
ncbi:hypothetical protein MKX01_040709 [Papaver californicum]|nr:hypothetical protein MKX01_040709 [Papaver californicum]